MTVFNIPIVSTIPQGESIRRAAELLRAHEVGCLVVVDENGLGVGMLTDRDLALRAIAFNRDPLETTAAEVMTSPLVSVEANTDLDEVASRMRAGGLRRIPVLREGHPIGLFSLDDILADLSHALRDVSEVQAPRPRSEEDGTADDLMSEISAGLRHANEKLRETSWRAQNAFLSELDDVRDRVKHALEVLLHPRS